MTYLHVVHLSDIRYSNGAWNKQGTSIKLKRSKVKLIHLSYKAAANFYYLMSVTQDNSFSYIKNKLCASGVIKTSNYDNFSSTLGTRNLATHSWLYICVALINFQLCAMKFYNYTSVCKSHFFLRSYNALFSTTSTNIKVQQARI